VFGVVALIDLLYQFWVHTEHVGRLGWFDRWFVSPSNHRVHHAIQDEYLDKQLRRHPDRLGPSVRHLRVEEDDAEPCVYGTTQVRCAAGTRSGRTCSFYAEMAFATAGTPALLGGQGANVWFAPPGLAAGGRRGAVARRARVRPCGKVRALRSRRCRAARQAAARWRAVPGSRWSARLLTVAVGGAPAVAMSRAWLRGRWSRSCATAVAGRAHVFGQGRRVNPAPLAKTPKPSQGLPCSCFPEVASRSGPTRAAREVNRLPSLTD
jgi:hypothetical protein